MILDIITQIICSFGGTVAFSILFNVPRKYYVWCGVTGTVGWLAYCTAITMTSVTTASFIGTIIVVLMSRVLAVYKKCPITIFLVSGIFPLLPSANVYYTAYYLFQNEVEVAVDRGMLAIKIAFAMVMAIVFVVSIPKEKFQRKNKKEIEA